MREIKTIEIYLDERSKREFTVKELTVQDILDLFQTNSLIKGGKREKPGVNIPGFSFINLLLSFKPDVEEIMRRSCDFTFEELLTLPPSDIKRLYDGFQEVNQTFFDVSEKLGIREMLIGILETEKVESTTDFSEPPLG